MEWEETRTPALQTETGITSRKLTFRDIFTSREILFLYLMVLALIQREKLTRRVGWVTLTTVA